MHANSVKTLLQTSKLQSLIWYKEQYASRQCACNAFGLCLSLSEVYCSIYAPDLGQSAADSMVQILVHLQQEQTWHANCINQKPISFTCISFIWTGLSGCFTFHSSKHSSGILGISWRGHDWDEHQQTQCSLSHVLMVLEWTVLDRLSLWMSINKLDQLTSILYTQRILHWMTGRRWWNTQLTLVDVF